MQFREVLFVKILSGGDGFGSYHNPRFLIVVELTILVISYKFGGS